jgi:hypothetical protein
MQVAESSVTFGNPDWRTRMTTSHFSQTDLRRCILVMLAAGLIACSSSSTGLSSDTGKIDADGIDGARGQGGTGGGFGKIDASGEAGLALPGTGGSIGSDGGLVGRGGAGGATAQPGAGGTGVDASGMAGAVGTGGRAGGAGGTTRRDAGTRLDAPIATDVASDSQVTIRDVAADLADAAAIDGGEACGNLDEACCASRACNLPNLVCESGAAGGGTCAACGGAGEPCCEGGVCTAPNTSCSGGGRSGGTCR